MRFQRKLGLPILTRIGLAQYPFLQGFRVTFNKGILGAKKSTRVDSRFILCAPYFGPLQGLPMWYGFSPSVGPFKKWSRIPACVKAQPVWVRKFGQKMELQTQ